MLHFGRIKLSGDLYFLRSLPASSMADQKLILKAVKTLRGLKPEYTEEEKKVIKEHNANQSAQRVMFGWR